MFISVAPEAHAALTESQIQAILSLLNSFGADSSTTNNVNASLRGLAPAATPTTSVASDDDENSSSISAHKMECPALKSSLSRGKSGSEVARLQEFIMDYFKLDDDISTGYYGPRTEKYIKQFQAKHGIAQVGYVGAQTRAAIARACGNSTIEPVPATNSPITYDTRIAEARHNEKIVPLASCGNGNDFYDGGADLDTLTYSGKRSDFFVTKHSDGSYTFKDLIACRADTDTVINIERFIFAGTAIEIQNLNPDKIDDATLSCPQITRPACGDGAFISRGTDANGCSLGYYCGDVQPSATSTQISQTVSGITVLDSVVTKQYTSLYPQCPCLICWPLCFVYS
jgi:peptidoglycan hydrolase-like protein with peptidoglycan-binding domain